MNIKFRQSSKYSMPEELIITISRHTEVPAEMSVKTYLAVKSVFNSVALPAPFIPAEGVE